MARRYAQEAIALDPEFSAAYRTLAAVMINESFVSAARVPQTELAQQALMLAEKGVALDQNSSSSYATLSLVHVFFRRIRRGRVWLRKKRFRCPLTRPTATMPWVRR